MNNASPDALKLLTQYKKLSLKPKDSLSEAEKKQLADLEIKLASLLAAKNKDANQRQTVRVPVAKKEHIVQFQSLGELKRCYISNVSGGGIFIETKDLLPVGSPLDLELTLPTETESFHVKAEVAWVSTKPIGKLSVGMGLKFLNLEDKKQTKIQRLVNQCLDQQFGGASINTIKTKK